MTSTTVEDWAKSLSDEGVVTLCNALNEILNGPDAIEEWEFESRVGVTREQALSLLSDLTRITKSIQQ